MMKCIYREFGTRPIPKDKNARAKPVEKSKRYMPLASKWAAARHRRDSLAQNQYVAGVDLQDGWKEDAYV